MPLFICNIFKCKFKSCLRNSLHFLWKKFILNINLELILHNISCGVKRIPPNVQTNISNIYRITITTYCNYIFVVLPISNDLASWRNGIASDCDMNGTLPLPRVRVLATPLSFFNFSFFFFLNGFL